jgi:parallel beta-helix repeat protein
LTLADLRLTSAPDPLAVYFVTDSGKEGYFRYDSSDTSSADNTGTVVVSTSGARFKRMTDGEFVNVKWFDAKGDGIADDTAAMQTALYAGAGTVFVPDGIYIVDGVVSWANRDTPNRGLDIPDNTHLQLSPKAVIRIVTNSSDSYTIIRVQDRSNVRISGGTIEGDRTTHTGSGGEWGYGICLNGAKNVTIENIIVRNCWGDGVFISRSVATTAPSSNIKIVGLTSDNNRRQGMSCLAVDGLYVGGSSFRNTNGTPPQSGIDFEAELDMTNKNIKIIGCEFVNNAGDGIQLNNAASHFIFSSCTFVGNGGRGVSAFLNAYGSIIGNTFTSHTANNAIMVLNCNYMTVSENLCTGNKVGIYLGTSAPHLSIRSGDHNTIANNTVESNTQWGMIVASSYNQVSGNHVHNNAGVGLYLYAATHTKVTDNKVSQNGTGIFASDGSSDNTIRGNIVERNNKDGISINGGTNYLAADNYCTSNGQLTNATFSNMVLNACTNSSVLNNFCRRGDLTNKPANGISLSGAGNANLVTNNDCYQGGTGNGIKDSNTATVFGAGNRTNGGTFSVTPS